MKCHIKEGWRECVHRGEEKHGPDLLKAATAVGGDRRENHPEAFDCYMKIYLKLKQEAEAVLTTVSFF